MITCDMTEHCTIILPHSRLPNVSRILWEIVFNEDKRLWEVDDLAAGSWPPWLVSSWMLIVCFRVFWFTLLIVNLRSSRWTELSAVCLRNTSKSPLSERLTSWLVRSTSYLIQFYVLLYFWCFSERLSDIT